MHNLYLYICENAKLPKHVQGSRKIGEGHIHIFVFTSIKQWISKEISNPEYDYINSLPLPRNYHSSTVNDVTNLQAVADLYKCCCNNLLSGYVFSACSQLVDNVSAAF